MKKYTNHLKFKYKKGKSGNLFVVLPGAGYREGSHDNFVKNLASLGSVLLITSGYYGLSELSPLHHHKKYKSKNFSQNLHNLIRQYPHKKLVLIGSSVGCFQAICYRKIYPREKSILVLTSLPVYKSGWNLLMFLLSMLFLHTPQISYKVFQKLLKLTHTLQFSNILENTVRQVGGKSYFYSLAEMATLRLFQKKYIKEIIANSFIIYGKDDPILPFIDQNIVPFAGSHFTPGKHAVLVTSAAAASACIQTQLKLISSPSIKFKK